MQWDRLNASIALVVSSLLAYGVYSWANLQSRELVAVGTFAFLGMTGTAAVAVSFGLPRTTINVRILSACFFTLGIAINALFANLGSLPALYVIVSGIAAALYLLLARSIVGAGQ